MQRLPPNSIDAIVTDPPYGLSFMGKDWDTLGKSRRTRKSGDCPKVLRGLSPGISAAQHASYEWHYRWAVQVLRVLKPGAHLLAFGGTRTHHRLYCAIEDAGFEIRDTLMWLYGQGFPKSLDVSKALDKAAGAERRRLGRRIAADGTPVGGRKNVTCGEGWQRPWRDKPLEDQGQAWDSAPATEMARVWEGWGTGLKPAWEAICLARKPLDGTVAHNVQRWGTGALNIEACRIVGADGSGNWGSSNVHCKPAFCSARTRHEYRTERHSSGRFPANLILGCSCPPSRKSDTSDPSNPTEAHLPSCPVALLDSQSGKSVRAGNLQPARFGSKGGRTSVWGIGAEVPHVYDRGGFASRFFYCAKASRSERDGRNLTGNSPHRLNGSGKLVNGTGKVKLVQNNHPTVKPVALMRWLVRLVTPPGGLVLDPFAGSGSTGVACRQQGFRYLGIDLNPEYVRIARARIASARPISTSTLTSTSSR